MTTHVLVQELKNVFNQAVSDSLKGAKGKRRKVNTPPRGRSHPTSRMRYIVLSDYRSEELTIRNEEIVIVKQFYYATHF